MLVYLSEYIYPKAAELLRQQATVVDTFDNIEEIDAIIVRGASVTAEMMDRAKKHSGDLHPHRQRRFRG